MPPLCWLLLALNETRHPMAKRVALQQRHTTTVRQSLTALATRNCNWYLMQTITVQCSSAKIQLYSPFAPLRTCRWHVHAPAAVGAVKKKHATKATSHQCIPPCSKGSAVHGPRASLPDLLSNPTQGDQYPPSHPPGSHCQWSPSLTTLHQQGECQLNS